MLMNKGENINCRAITVQVFKVVVLIGELSTAIEKLKGYIKASIYIG